MGVKRGGRDCCFHFLKIKKFGFCTRKVSVTPDESWIRGEERALIHPYPRILALKSKRVGIMRQREAVD